MNNGYISTKSKLFGVVDMVVYEMESIDKNWKVIAIDVVVNVLERKLVFCPMYLSGNESGEKVLVLQNNTKRAIEAMLFRLYSVAENNASNHWNKLRLRISNNDFRNYFNVKQKYDRDLDWYYENKKYRHRLTLADELQIISFEGLPKDYKRFWYDNYEVF